MNSFWWRSVACGAGLALFGLAIVLRVECARDEFWIDEYITAWTTSDSWSDAWRRAAISNQPPLYNLLLFGSTQCLGESPAILRGLSLVCGIGVVALGSWFVFRLTTSRGAALLALFTSAIDQHFVFYASEARSYALAQLLGLVAAFSAWHFLFADPHRNAASRQPPMGWTLACTASLVAMFYAHYTSLFAVAAMFAVMTVTLHVQRRLTKVWWVMMAAAGVACAPGLAALRKISQFAMDWQAFSSIEDLWQSLQPSCWIYLVPAIGFAFAGYLGKKRVKRELIAAHVFLLSIVVLTIACVIVSTLSEVAPLGHYRYIISVTGVLPVVGATFLARTSPIAIRVIAALAVAVVAWTMTPVGHDLSHGTLQRPLRFERWIRVAQEIDQASGTIALPLIVLPNLIEDYRAGEWPADPDRSYFWAPFEVLNRPTRVSATIALPTWTISKFEPALLERMKTAGGAWLVIRGLSEQDQLRGNSALSIVMRELKAKSHPRKGYWLARKCEPQASDVRLFRLTWHPSTDSD